MRYLGIDIGGTAIKYGVYDELGNPSVNEQGVVPSLRHDLDEIMNLLETLVHQFENISAIGLSIPGAVDSLNQYVIEGGAIEPLANQKIGKLLETRTGIPCVIENDANCAILAEHWVGHGKGCESIVCMTIGTGIGGSHMVNGSLVRGHHNLAGEYGYMITKGLSDDHSFSIMSDNSSTEALIKAVATALSVDHKTLSGEAIFTRIRNHDQQVREVYEDWLKNLAIGIYNLAFILDPEIILIGGGVSQVEFLIEDLQRTFKTLLPFPIPWIIASCKHFNDAGKIGAVYSCMNRKEPIS